MMKSGLFLIFFVTSFCLGVVLSQSIPIRRNRDKIIKKVTTTTTRAPFNEDETSEDCPEPFGYFADADQCDKYHACNDGRIEERLCPDGLVFNDYDIEVEKCDLPYNIDCSKRPNLQTPIPSNNCPRQNGYFAHQQGNICDKFYYCVAGQFNMITCPQGLVFNPKTGICTWPDEAQKKGCGSEDVFNFKCKKVNESVAITHPRYEDPENCQFFYVCINGDVPRHNGCKLGQVFNEANGNCDSPRNVPKCRDFYKDRLTEEQLDEIENPKTTAVPKKSKRPSRPQRKRPTARAEEEQDEE